MERASNVVLVVGSEEGLAPALVAALERCRPGPILSVPDVPAAYEVAAASDLALVLLDFDELGDDGDVAADILRAMAPTGWVLDFKGIVRRRPDHAPISMAHTHPLVFA